MGCKRQSAARKHGLRGGLGLCFLFALKLCKFGDALAPCLHCPLCPSGLMRVVLVWQEGQVAFVGVPEEDCSALWFNVFLMARKDVWVRWSCEPHHFDIASTNPALFAGSIPGTVILCVLGVRERGHPNAAVAPGLCCCYWKHWRRTEILGVVEGRGLHSEPISWWVRSQGSQSRVVSVLS